MATVFWTPKLADVGSVPSDVTYTTPWASVAGSSVTADSGDGRYWTLDFSTSASARRVFRVSEIAGLSVDAVNDVEIYCRYKINGSTNDFYAHGRVSGSASSEESLWMRVQRGTGSIKTAGYYDAGSTTTLHDDSVGDKSFIIRHLRLRINGTSFKGRYWDDGSSEPGTWDFEVTQSNVTTGGGIGFGRFSNSSFSTVFVYDIGVGTGGDTAPTSAPAGDVTAPVLTSPTGTQTSATTATGTVSTDENNGTLDAVVTTSATTPTAVQIQAGQDHTGAAAAATDLNNTVTATGSQSVSFTGLTPSTTYYVHYVHEDAATNVSTAVSSAGFTTAASDVTAPILSTPTGTQTGTTTADLSVSTDEGNGTLYWVVSTSATPPSVAQIQAGNDSTGSAAAASGNQVVSGTGAQTPSATGLTAATTYYAYFQQEDAATNDSTVAASASFATASGVATVTVTDPLKNNTGTLWASETGIKAAVLNATTLESVYEVTGLTTNASGVLEAISNAALNASDDYHVAIKLSDGSVGITGVITAT